MLTISGWSQKELVIYFDSDRYSLSNTNKLKVDAFLKSVLLNKKRLLIEGYTDQEGEEDYNIELSRKRCEAVQNYLIENDYFEVKRISMNTYGESIQLKGSLAINRRVVLRLIDTQENDVNSTLLLAKSTNGANISSTSGKNYSVKLRELFTQEDMFENKIFPVSVDGMGIVTAGMVEVSPDTKEDSLQMMNDTLQLCVPAGEKREKFTLWNIEEDEKGNKRWKNLEIPFVYDGQTNEYCVTALGKYLIGFVNPDFVAPGPQFQICFILTDTKVERLKNVNFSYAGEEMGYLFGYSEDTIYFNITDTSNKNVNDCYFGLNGVGNYGQQISASMQISNMDYVYSYETNNYARFFYLVDDIDKLKSISNEKLPIVEEEMVKTSDKKKENLWKRFFSMFRNRKKDN